MSVYTTVFAGSTPIGGLLMGFIAARFGVAEAFALGGIVCVFVGAGAIAWLRRIHATDRARARLTTAGALAAAESSLTAARPR
jgi:predicted lipid-binding transport protein (Tim44 family)